MIWDMVGLTASHNSLRQTYRAILGFDRNAMTICVTPDDFDWHYVNCRVGTAVVAAMAGRLS